MVREALACLLVLSAPAIPAELPPNTWVQVEAGGGGVRRGSAVAWLPRERAFLVAGGVRGNEKKGIPRPFEIQAFDPANRTWAEWRPEGLDLAAFRKRAHALLWANDEGQWRLHPEKAIASSAAYDPVGRQLYVVEGNDPRAPDRFLIARYDVAARRWEVASGLKPPAEADGVLPGEFGPTMAFLSGATLVHDPVNRELLLIGGRTGDAPRGFVGHWAFSLAAKTWRRLDARCEVLDPLRAACEAAEAPARDGLAAARQILHSPVDPVEDARATKGLPARLVGEAARRGEEALAQLRAAAAPGWKAEAVARAAARLAGAVRGLEAAAAAFAEGSIDAERVRRVHDAAWALDEAADLLRPLPGPRMHAAAGYDPEARCVVVFGGDHGDYLLSDTWLYEVAARTWRRAFPETAPAARRGSLCWLPASRRLALVGGETYEPKFMLFRRRPRRLDDAWAFDAEHERWALVTAGAGEGPRPTLTCQLAAGDGDVVLGLSSAGRWPQQWDGTAWLLRVAGEAASAEAAKAGVPPGRRTYLSVVEPYDPCWYDAAPRTDGSAVKAWLAKLPPNAWTAVPPAPRPAPPRDWGTAVFDPHRDQIYHWTGGHMADPSSIVSTYHPATNRWSIPYVAGYFGKGIGFNGRPDCMNHTYLNYAFDPVSRRLVCTSFGGTCVYDPDRREFEPRVDQPFRQHPYFTKTVSTPRGVVCWDRGGFLGVLDVAERVWKPLPARGSLPRVVHGDENAIVYDSRRDVLWLLAADAYQKPNGQVWRYEMKTGQVEPMSPAGRKTIGVKYRPREAVYLPALDLVLCNGFAGERQIAYDPQRNRWVTLSIPKTHKGLGGVGIGLMHDPGRGLVWAVGSGRRMYVLRPEAATLGVSDGP